MIKVNLNTIKEIRLCWDWARAIIPQNKIKILKYEGLTNSDGYECDYVFLSMDLDYIKNNDYYTGNDIEYYQKNKISSDSEETIYEALQNYNVWDIEIIYLNGNSVLLNLPSKTVGDEWSRNTLEHHQEKDEALNIRWATLGALQDIRKRNIDVKKLK